VRTAPRMRLLGDSRAFAPGAEVGAEPHRDRASAVRHASAPGGQARPRLFDLGAHPAQHRRPLDGCVADFDLIILIHWSLPVAGPRAAVSQSAAQGPRSAQHRQWEAQCVLIDFPALSDEASIGHSPAGSYTHYSRHFDVGVQREGL
jgi:hypothetical protein